MKRMTYSSPDLRDCGKSIDHSEGDRLFLPRSSACACDPSENNTMASIYSDREHTHSKIAGANIECGAPDDKARDGYSFCNCYVPCTLITLACYMLAL